MPLELLLEDGDWLKLERRGILFSTLKDGSSSIGRKRLYVTEIILDTKQRRNIEMAKLKTILAAVLLALLILVCYYFLSGKGFGLSNSNWIFVVLNICFFSMFFFFIPFKRKVKRRSASIYLAFIVGLYFEMYGIPLTMYIFMWGFGFSNVPTFEFLLSGVMGADLFYAVFTYFIFPATALIMVIGISDSFWLEKDS